jgi:glycosyltransferase involved in cell wall biosynthesis
LPEGLSANLDLNFLQEIEPFFWTPERQNSSPRCYPYIPVLLWLISVCRPRVAVEFGSDNWMSYAALCEGVARQDSGGRCYSISGCAGDGRMSPNGVAFEDFRKFHDRRYTAFSELVANFDEGLNRFDDGAIDLLHCNSLEAHETALRDFNSLLPKLSERGVILLSNIMVQPGAVRLFHELEASYPTFALRDGPGVGLIAFGPHAPEPVKQLCALQDADARTAIREQFAHAGIRWILEQAVLQKDRQIESLLAKLQATENTIAETAARVDHLQDMTSIKDAQIAEYLMHLNRINASPWWQIGMWITRRVAQAAAVLQRKPKKGGKNSDTGPGVLSTRSYKKWIEFYDTLTSEDRRAIQDHIRALRYQPLISIVMPAYNTPEKCLREAIESVRAQLYTNWELCVADDASASPTVSAVLQEFANLDPRVKWVRRPLNGHISEASNSALQLATGEFVALMDHDDLLAETALYEIVVELNAHPDADLIYSDEDRINDDGKRHSPYFKTDWNPELFLGQNLINHLGVYRRSLVGKVGGFRKGFEGSQDYDLALRIICATSDDKIRHIPAILYHWRGGSVTASFSENQLQRCIAAARSAKAEFLAARGETAVVLENPFVPFWDRVRRPVPSPAPLVSLIVPTRNRHDLLGPCLDGLLGRTDYHPIEVIIIDHESDDPETISLLAKWRSDTRVRIMNYKGAFNYSDMNNKAVAQARGDIIGLINNDIDVINPDWLSEMVSLAVLPNNGAVGAKLLYPNDLVQHAGVALGIGGIAGHPHLSAMRPDTGYFGRLALTSNVSAVTAACLVVRKALFEEVGGLDAVNLPVAFNDVDLCLKIKAKGYRNVWTPFALLYHHESPSRGSDGDPDKAARARREIEFMRCKWGYEINRDPYFNLNLSLQSPSFHLAFPPRRQKPWKTSAHEEH